MQGGGIRRKNWFRLSFIVLLFILSKNQGFYFAIIILLIYAVFYKKYWKQLLFSFGVPLVFFSVIWLRVLLPSWNVAPGGKQEMLGFMFQQTARYVVDYEDDVTESEREIIARVLDYDHLADKYNPTLQDPVKFTFNQYATKEMMNDYYCVWWRMFFKHPDSYVQSILNNVYGFYYLNRNSGTLYLEFVNYDDVGNELTIYGSMWHEEVSESARELISMLHRIPVVGMLFCIQMYVWIPIAYLFYMTYTKRYNYILPAIVAILSVGILIVSPANGNFRYMMPLLYTAPFLFCVGTLAQKTNVIIPVGIMS